MADTRHAPQAGAIKPIAGGKAGDCLQVVHSVTLSLEPESDISGGIGGRTAPRLRARGVIRRPIDLGKSPTYRHFSMVSWLSPCLLLVCKLTNISCGLRVDSGIPGPCRAGRQAPPHPASEQRGDNANARRGYRYETCRQGRGLQDAIRSAYTTASSAPAATVTIDSTMSPKVLRTS